MLWILNQSCCKENIELFTEQEEIGIYNVKKNISIFNSKVWIKCQNRSIKHFSFAKTRKSTIWHYFLNSLCVYFWREENVLRIQIVRNTADHVSVVYTYHFWNQVPCGQGLLSYFFPRKWRGSKTTALCRTKRNTNLEEAIF